MLGGGVVGRNDIGSGDCVGDEGHVPMHSRLKISSKYIGPKQLKNGSKSIKLSISADCVSLNYSIEHDSDLLHLKVTS